MGKGRATFRLYDTEIEQEFYLAKHCLFNLLVIEAIDKFELLENLRRQLTNVQRTPELHNAIEVLKNEFNEIFRDKLGHCVKA